MMLYVADPIVFLAPPAHATKEEWEQYQAILQECHKIANSDVHQIALSHACGGELHLSERYPKSAQQLQDWLGNAGVDTFDAKSLLSLLRVIQRHAVYLEDHFGIKTEHDLDAPEALWIHVDDLSFLIEETAITVQPSFLLERLATFPALARAFRFTAGLLVYALAYQEQPPVAHGDIAVFSLETHASEAPAPQGDHITITATITEKSEVEKRISIALLLNGRSIKAVADEIKTILEFWPNFEQMLHYACSVDGCVVDVLAPHTFAQTFQPSFESAHLNENADEVLKVFKKIIYLLQDSALDRPPSPPNPSKHNHPVKRQNGQIMDEGWGAWRYRLWGRHHRMHYWWRDADKHYLFSKVVVGHTDLDIDPNTAEKRRRRLS